MIGHEFPQLLADAERGDRAAIESIHRDVAPLVIGYLRANGAADPEDVASEVFVSVLRSLPSFEGDEQHFRSWLLRITHRRLVDAIRAMARRRDDPVPIEEVSQRMPTVSDTASEALARLASRGVLDALDRLTPDQRAVLMLRVLADLSVPEIAAIVDKPESAVKALLRRGTSSLRRLVSAPEDGEGGLGPHA